MMEPLISLTIDSPRLVRKPGDRLYCELQVDAVEKDELKAVEISVLWWTEGKGDEDFGVHFFERRTPADAEDNDLRLLHCFETKLPNSPLTYHGAIVKIRWCVRVRAFLKGGKETFFEHPFELGNSSNGGVATVGKDSKEKNAKPTDTRATEADDAER